MDFTCHLGFVIWNFGKMSKLITIPAPIDPHVHFRTPGGEHKENFDSGTAAALAGGYTCVLEMPNTNPPTTTEKELDWKIKRAKDLPIVCGFHFGATKDNLPEIKKVEERIASIKIFFGSSTGELLLNDLAVIEKIMRETKKIITVHGEDEDVIQENIKKHGHLNEPKIHNLVRHPKAAASAIEKLLKLVKKTGHPIYFCHVSTRGELELIKGAKKDGLPVYAEATPHHLFLDETEHSNWGNFVKVNPPLRHKDDTLALWEAVRDGTIDAIGSDHAPHLPSEKDQSYWQAPSGIPGVETTLPLLFDASTRGLISIDKIIELTCVGPAKIFGINLCDSETTIDLSLRKKVNKKNLKTKCGWTPYEGMELAGWPIKTKVLGKTVYEMLT